MSKQSDLRYTVGRTDQALAALLRKPKLLSKLLPERHRLAVLTRQLAEFDCAVCFFARVHAALRRG